MARSHQQTFEHERKINCALVVIGGFTIKTQQFTQMMIGELKRYSECQIKKCTLLSNAEYQTTVLSSKLIDLSSQHNQDSLVGMKQECVKPEQDRTQVQQSLTSLSLETVTQVHQSLTVITFLPQHLRRDAGSPRGKYSK